MSDYQVEFVLREGMRLLACWCRYPEARAREWAARMTRSQKTGARIVGPDGDLAWFLWLLDEARVVEVPPGTAAEAVRACAVLHGRRETFCPP